MLFCTFLALRTISPMFKVILGIDNYSYVASYLVTLDLIYKMLYTSAVQLQNAPESTSEHPKMQKFLGACLIPPTGGGPKGPPSALVSVNV